jgi:uncharacterized repeat protein (TIGR02543 family)
MKKRALIILLAFALVLVLSALSQSVRAQPYNIEFVSNPAGAGTILPASGSYEYETVLSLEATAVSGWQFDSWTDPSGQIDGATTNPIGYEVTGDVTITANFTEIVTCFPLTLTVTSTPTEPGNSVSALGNSEGCPTGQYRSGTTVNLLATAVNGYQVGWTGATPVPETPRTATVVMNGPRSVTAAFTLRCQELLRFHTPPGAESGADPTAAPGQSSGCSAGFYKKGETITLTAAPSANWRVGSWTGTNDSSSNVLTMPGLPTAASTHSVTVNYVKKPTLEFAQASYQVAENAGIATIELKRSGSTAEEVKVSYAPGPTGNTAVPGLDYDAQSASGQATFLSGSDTATFDITLLDDSFADGEKKLTLKLSNPTNGAVLGAATTAELRITDDEGPAIIQFSSSSYSGEESAGSIGVTVTISPPPTGDVSVRLNTVNGTAVAGEDYIAIKNRSLGFYFDSGETSKTVQVSIIPDDIDEQDETIGLILDRPNGPAQLSSENTAEITILDDDDTPTVQFSAGEYFAKTGESSILIPVNLSAPSGQSVTVDYGIIRERDNNTTNGTLIFLPGETTRNITLSLVGAVEGDKYTAQLKDPSHAVLGQPATAILRVLDTGPEDCNELLFTYTGYGEPPTAVSPENSLGCANGWFVAGEEIIILARPAPGWYVSHWQETTNEDRDAFEYNLVMPDAPYTVNADYLTATFLTVAYGPEIFFEGPVEQEPNNLFAEANGPLVHNRTYFGDFSTAADTEDRFYFNLGTSAEVTITLDSIQAGQDYNLYLYSADWNSPGGLQGYSGRVGNLKETIVKTVGPGKYYIRIDHASGSPTTDQYEMTLAVK